MFKVFMTDALIANVNDYVIKNVLPIAPVSDEERAAWAGRDSEGRRPYRPDANKRAPRGFKSVGVTFPLREFKTCTVMSETGIPIFDGHGEVWLVNTGIVVVFKDADMYCVVSDIQLHNWLLSEIHNALFVEYEKVLAGQRPAKVLPKPELIVDGIWESPIWPDDVVTYFTEDQYCHEMREPRSGKDVSKAAKKILVTLISNFIVGLALPDPIKAVVPMLVIEPGINAIQSSTNPYVGQRAMYAFMQAMSANFLHLFTKCGVVIDIPAGATTEPVKMTLEDIMLFRTETEGDCGLLLRFIEEPTCAIIMALDEDSLKALWGFVLKYGMDSAHHYKAREWIASHLF